MVGTVRQGRLSEVDLADKTEVGERRMAVGDVGYGIDGIG